MIHIEIEIQKNISPELFEKIRAGAKAAMLSGGEHLKGKLVIYPEERHGPAIWSDDPDKRRKQQSGFFYHLHHGDIEVPYRRGQSPKSETLSKRWTVVAVKDTPDEIVVEVGNNTSYGPLVMSREKQTRYHQLTGWLTTEDVKEKEEEGVVKMIHEAIAREIERIGK